METRPAPLGLMREDDSLDDFRIVSAVEIQAILRQLLETHTMVTLSSPGGASYTTLLWAVDTSRGVICFSAESGDPRLQQLLDSNEIVAVAYLDSIKVQFDLEGAVQVRGGDTALNANFPRELYRFQRRSSFRVKPLLSNAPTAHFRHPALPDMQLSLRILDISLGGVALAVPKDVPSIAAGIHIRRCLLELDADTHLDVGLSIHHVTVLNESQGARLGCEIEGLHGSDERALQNYINQTQKRRNAMAVG
jgi:c-di-GMP-binding flagellar brake protein YcgR